jgi:transposase
MTRRYKYASVFKELYSFRGYKFNGFFNEKDVFFVFLAKKNKTCKCPSCGKRCRNIEESYKRTLRDIDLGDKKCYVTFFEHKIQCSCGYRGIEELEFVRPYSRCTQRFEEYVAFLSEKMSLSDVGQLTGLGWRTIKAIDKAKLRDLILDVRQLEPKRLGIDEIAYQKGHKYLTVVRDIDLGKVIWVGTKRKRETLDKFFSELGIRKSMQIKVIVVDMWDPYIASIKANTRAAIVFDKFHISKVVNDAVDKVRKKEFAKADKEERKLMKKKRFLILSRQKRLDEAKKERLRDLLDINKTLYGAYLLKEQILDIFDEENKSSAMKRLEKWLKNVSDAGIQQFETAAKRIMNYFYGIANFFEHKVTNGQSEGFNNKINVIKRRAYGYRDWEYFKLKILQSGGWRSS